jgi:type IV pilus assembly protein PilX
MMQTQYPSRQKGSALVVALTILLVLTILGVSAMRGTALQDKMAGNALDSQIAFEAAEFALRDAEKKLEDGTIDDGDFADDGGLGAYFNAKGLNPAAWQDENNWNNKAVDADTYNGNVAQWPEFIIQKIDTNVTYNDTPDTGEGYGLPPLYDLKVYEITARGYGVSPNSRVMLQVYFRM